MHKPSADTMTIRETAGIAITAYVAVKVFRGLSMMVADAVSFKRNRKAAKQAK